MEQLRVNIFKKRFKSNGISVEKQLQKIQSEVFENPADSSGIYIIHSKVNDFIYIGSAARTFSQRWNEHIKELKKLRHSNGLLQFLYCKYGIENLEFYILEICPPEECLKRESINVKNLIPELNLNALLGTWGFSSIQGKEWEEWYSTAEGQQYKKNTLIVKRQKWLKTKVGRDCARQDIKNLRERLNQSNKSIDEKTSEILNYCREYFPDIEIPAKTLEEFVNNGTHFKPIWDRPGKIKSFHKEIVKSENEVFSLTKTISKSINQNKRSQDLKNENIGCIIIIILFILLFLIFKWN